MTYVPLDEVVADAISIVGVGNDEEAMKLLARQWIWRAVLKLPITEDNIEVCNVTVKNLTIKKPPGMRRPLELSLYDSSGYFVPHVFQGGKKRIYPDTRLIPFPPDNLPPNSFAVDLSEDEYAFHLGTNGSNVAGALIRFFAYPLDKAGMPMIREEDVLTCMYFVRLMASLRKNDNRSEIAQNRELFDQEIDIQKARRKSEISNDEKKEISSIMNRMIPQFNRSNF